MSISVVKYLALLLIFLATLACEKSPTNPEAIFTLTGFIYEAETNPPIPISGARVMVGDVYGISDSTGHFVVDDILGRKGVDNQYVLTISHPNYDTLRQTVIIRSDMEKNCFLVRKSIIFTLTGFVYEANTNPPVPVVGARVLVGDVYDFSDSTGYFIIDDILGREGVDNVHVFRIFHSMFDSLRETVIMRSDTTKNFFLVKKVDFFPVAPGNWWKYDYSYNIKHQNYRSSFVGQLKWELFLDEGKYKIKEEKAGIYYNSDLNPQWDSTYTNTTDFLITDSDLVTLYRNDWVPIAGSTAPMKYRIYRFQSPTIGDTLHIDEKLEYDYYYKADYVKNIGLVSWDWYGPSYHVTIKEKAYLIEYHINN